MKTYKIKINIEREIDAENEQQALEKFWQNETYEQHDLENLIDENLEVEEMK